MSFDIYQEITDRIIAELKAGKIPWKKPWTGSADGAISHLTGKAYSLLNQMLLRDPGEYVTYKQAQAEGGQVRKGSHGRMVVFWKILDRPQTDGTGGTVTDKDGNTVFSHIPFLQYYTVFHLSDCDNLPAKWTKDTPETTPTAAQIDASAAKVFSDYITRSGVTFEESKQDRACYSPTYDRISLPLMNQFAATAEYYSTAYHEAVHSTGHKKRLDRFGPAQQIAAFGDEDYSKEELVAEIGASALVHTVGLETPASFKNSAAYVQSWLRVLQNDKKFIVSAAGKADKAMQYILTGTITAGEPAQA